MGGTVRGGGKRVLGKSPGLLTGPYPHPPQNPKPPSPGQIQTLESVAGEALGWKEQRRQTKHTAPALSQVLYFPEVMAKGRRKGRARKGRQKEPERARRWEERGQ